MSSVALVDPVSKLPVELIGSVFSFLPPTEVFLSCRVCKTWKKFSEMEDVLEAQVNNQQKDVERRAVVIKTFNSNQKGLYADDYKQAVAQFAAISSPLMQVRILDDVGCRNVFFESLLKAMSKDGLYQLTAPKYGILVVDRVGKAYEELAGYLKVLKSCASLLKPLTVAK